jgi:hypothetical protein
MTEKQPITAADVMGRWEYFPDNEIFDMPGEEGEQEVDRIHDAIKMLEQQGSVSEMFKLAYLFRDNHDSWDVEHTYLHALERIPSYPSAELFTTTYVNDMIVRLRQRCLNSHLVVQDEEITTFYDIAVNVFANEKNGRSVDNISKWVTYELIEKMTKHEVRLTLELLHSSGLEIRFNTFNRLISRLEDRNNAN